MQIHRRSRLAKGWAAVALVAVMLSASSCAVTRQPRQAPTPQGFLGDYSQLREGKGDEAALIYINPTARFGDYDAILLDSVTMWANSETSKLSAEQRQALTDYLFEALYRELGKDYRIVYTPGPRVMRLRAAITEATGSKVVLDTITSIVPQARLLSTLGGMAADTSMLVGTAGIEAELLDAISNQRLAAAVDERWGTKAVRGGIGKWDDAKNAFDYWAERLRKRLAVARGDAVEE